MCLHAVLSAGMGVEAMATTLQRSEGAAMMIVQTMTGCHEERIRSWNAKLVLTIVLVVQS